MDYMAEATKLLNDSSGLTVSNFEKLIWLREQSQGKQAVVIGKLVESFILKAPPEVLKQIVVMV